MTNLVAITVKATDSSDYTAIKASAAKAGADAADEFNRAFKLKADAHASGSSSGGGGSDGLLGTDSGILSRLKSYANTPGGIGMLGTGSDTSLVSMLKNQIRAMGQNGGPSLLSGMSEGGQSTTDMVREVLQNSVTGNTSSEDLVKQVLENNVTGNVTTSDFIKQVLEGAGPGNVTTSDYIKQVVEGNTPGNISTEDIIHPMVDDSDIAALGKSDGKTYGDGFTGGSKDELGSAVDDAIKDSDVADKGSSDGKSYGSSFASSLMSTLTKALSGGGKGGGGSSVVGSLLTGGGGSGDAGAVAGALDSGGVAGGALPGIAGVSGMAATVTGLAAALVAVLPAITSVVGGLAAIGGGFAILEVTDKQFAADMKSTLGDLESVFSAAAMPLAKPLEEAATQIAGYFKQIEPDLKAVFADSATLIQPLVKGFEALMTGAGPGFLAMIKSAGPVFQSVSGAFAGLGKALGEMFQDFASDGKGSATILSGFLGIINSLLPFIGQLGKVLVSALAPAFSALSGTLSGLLPALTPLMGILGSFAGAVLTDLGSVLGAVGQLLAGLAPSFTTLAGVASNLFNTLENAGVFAVLGDVLENLAGPLAGLINALVKGLAPALPPIISAVGQIATLLAGQLGAALGDILKAITPIVSVVAKLVAGLVTWLSQNNLLIPVLVLIAGAIDPVGTSIALVGLAISELVTHWSAIWGEIKSIASDVGTFLDNLFHNQVVQDILAIWSAGLIPLAEHWSTVWGDIKGVAEAIASWLTGTFAGGIDTLFTHTIPGWWDDAYSAIKNTGADVINWFKALPGNIVGALGNAAGTLLGWGKDVISGLLTGLEDAWQAVVSWFASIPSKILAALGIHSPPDWAIQAGKDIMSGITQGLMGKANAVIGAAEAVAAGVSAALAATGGGSSGSVEALMKQMAAARGWTGAQWTDLYNVEMAEAGFNMNATNPSSGAYGLAQFIGGPSEYAQYGGNSSTASGQITGMLNYIAQRYGTPSAAWAHEQAYGWYDQGGWLPTGKSIAINNTGAPERVIGPGGINVSLELASSGNGGFDAFMLQWVRNAVRIKGGGNVQSAFGRSLVVSI